MNVKWVPNVLTLGNLILGFTALILASGDSPQDRMAPSILILGAALLDGLDGTLARKLKVSAPIGKELDSLADCVTFGIAPAYLAHRFYFQGMELSILGHDLDLGIMAAVLFPVCAAYRLARYNVFPTSASFEGLPSPVAGSLVALFPLSFQTGTVARPLIIAVYWSLAILMVSRIRYAKPQAGGLGTLQGIKLAGLVGLLLITLYVFGFWILFLFIGIYSLSGLFTFVLQLLQDQRN